ncbi:MAG: F0F1 ATP synthase subunit delta, partial [Myxococcota bacterium]
MTDRSLAHRYASALLQECGDSPDQLSEIARQLHVVAQTFSEPNSALRHLFLNPLFHVEQRLATLHRLQKNLNLHDIL